MAKKYTPAELESIDEQWRALFGEQEFVYVLVDNSVALRKTLANALQAAGCEAIVEAKDGMEAVMAIKKLEGKPVVITELNLPVMDGVQMLKQLRGAPGTKEIPVILVSAESRKEKIVRAIKHGVTAYLKKPFQPDTLIAKLKELGLL